MLTRLNRYKKDERGASLVEFALILPLLAAITFGMLSSGIPWLLIQTMPEQMAAAVRCARERSRVQMLAARP